MTNVVRNVYALSPIRIILAVIAILLVIIAIAGGTVFNLTELKEVGIAVLLLAIAVVVP